MTPEGQAVVPRDPEGPRHVTERARPSAGQARHRQGQVSRRLSYLDEICSRDADASGRVPGSGEQHGDCSLHAVRRLQLAQFVFRNILRNRHFQQFQRSLKDLRKRR